MKSAKIFVLTMITLSFAYSSYGEESLIQAFKDGKFYADLRLRYEMVDQEGLSKDANAKTARTRIGFKTGEWNHFSGVIEGENVSYLGKDRYNDTVNGRTNHPVVADPENTQVNQAYGEYTGVPDTTIKGGRQVLTLDGHRFIGHVGWRQNNQVFDALLVTNKMVTDTVVKYGYIWNVNRIFGEQSGGGDWGSKSHFYNISNTSTPLGKITHYGYFLDFGSDSTANASQTLGGSISGEKALCDEATLKYHLEYAHQSDYKSNTTQYDANYYHIAPALVFKGITATVGYEVLGSDDSAFAFRTPLATLHKWNGWVDKFLTTPAAGLEDIYVDITYKVKGLEGKMEFFNGLLAKFQYHHFSADDGGADYGDEWGIYLKKSIHENVTVDLKYADYNADSWATDTQKLVLGFNIKY